MSARFSETLMDHFQDPYNRGQLEHPTGVGVSGVPGQGPYFVIQIKSADRVVTQARFQCHNCGVTVASGSVLTTLVQGKSFEDCLRIDHATLIEALDGVPPDKSHVLEFVLCALRSALSELM